MARTKTRAERIDEKVKGGLSRVKAEIEVRREEMLAKLDALEAQEKQEEARLDAKVLVLLKEDEAGVYDRLRSKAEKAIDEERQERSRRSRSAAKGASESEGPAPDEGAAEATDSTGHPVNAYGG